MPGRAACHPFKHGVIGLARSAALEHDPRGIRINAVGPGTIEAPMVTEMIAKGELSVTDAVANQRSAASPEPMRSPPPCSGCACSPGASLIVGVALPVDGGYTAR